VQFSEVTKLRVMNKPPEHSSADNPLTGGPQLHCGERRQLRVRSSVVAHQWGGLQRTKTVPVGATGGGLSSSTHRVAREPPEHHVPDIRPVEHDDDRPVEPHPAR
jgi:hypothetical protein